MKTITSLINANKKVYVRMSSDEICKAFFAQAEKLRSQVDSKLLSEIEEKKRAHGLKTDRSVQSNDDSEEEYYGISM